MATKYRIGLVSLTAALVAALALAGVGECTKVAKLAASKPAATKAPSVPTGPKKLTVVAGVPFEQVPASGSSKVSIVLCPEETAPATFTVRYGKPLQNMRVVAVGDFAGPKPLGRANVEVSRLDGEKLLNDVAAGSGVTFATADLGAQPVQFWADITAPKGTAPGLYKGAIGFYQQDKLFDVVSIEVKVLPLRLLGSSRQFGIYTSCDPATMDTDKGTQAVKSMQKLGFKFVALNVEPAVIPQAMSGYTALGLSNPLPLVTYAFRGGVPTADEVKALEVSRKAAGQNSAFYFCVDDPTTPEQITMAQKQLKAFQNGDARTAVRVSDEAALLQLQENLDAIDYYVEMPYVQSMMNGTGKRTGKWEWYWWDARKSTSDNRLYAGAALWKSGLFGVMPVWMPEAGMGPTDGLNSLQCEALREGVTDTRYITTYMKALRELKDLKRGKDKDYIAETEAYLAKFMSQPLTSITPSKLAAFRAKMADYSLRLAARL